MRRNHTIKTGNSRHAEVADSMKLDDVAIYICKEKSVYHVIYFVQKTG